MSELQIALLSIGLLVIVAVYVFGWWQQWQLSRKYGTVFKANHDDALYREHETRASERSSESVAEMAEAVSTDPVVSLDEPCVLLDARSDFIIELRLAEPSPAAVLVGLWQRKFDFGKLVQVCGLKLDTRVWERTIAESHTLYERFRVALQLVDRGGAISAARLADFSDLVQGIARHIRAQATVPDVQKAYQHAVNLDALCARVDQMVGVNLVPQADHLIRATDIARAVGMRDMTLEADGAFHLLDAHGHTLFSLINLDTVPFQHHTLETFATGGITLLLDVPRVENPALRFEQMMDVVQELAQELRLSVVDDSRVALADAGMAHIRAQIAGVEASMSEQGIAPGSAQARRLFS